MSTPSIFCDTNSWLRAETSSHTHNATSQSTSTDLKQKHSTRMKTTAKIPTFSKNLKILLTHSNC